MSVDPAIKDHKAWLGYLQPEGLVVSPAALVDLQVILSRETIQLQERFLEMLEDVTLNDDTAILAVTDVPRFIREFLQWPDDCLVGLSQEKPVPESLQVPLPEYSETLAPSYVLVDSRPKDPAYPWLVMVKVLPAGADIDEDVTVEGSSWSSSHARRFERLLRETKVPIGLIINGTNFRLIYAPHGESAGSLTFKVNEMAEIAGRPILSAFSLLLDRSRLLVGPSEQRLPAILTKSREYQSMVSSVLAAQVLDALYELMRGFQSANEHARGELLKTVLAKNPDDVYSGLLTVLMRLVFQLYSEDRGLMPNTSLYVQHYSAHGLFEKLRDDNERYPDTMDHRYGAWARLTALFRAIYSGSRHPQLKIPARQGHLFDPDKYKFLEGRTMAVPQAPLISDGVIYRVLNKLLILDGERLSYRTLDVEEIGSVYQTIMGFRLEVANGQSIAIVGKRKHKQEVPAPTIINLEELLAKEKGQRSKWLKEQTQQEISGDAEKKLKEATAIDELLALLDSKKKIARNATPHVVPSGAMVLQPSDERRRSGSHYTPRTLTEPIVRTTLRPILERLGEKPKPEQILDLKMCDPAVGSGALLVEACRQLGDELVKAWHNHGQLPVIPPDEDEVLHARRMVAQRCLYGVDRNPMAADLAKLSLWLATLAKDHPFTFLDHSIRSGDSLVGLTRKQITDFHWKEEPLRALGQDVIERRIETATAARKDILNADEFISPLLKRQKLDAADEALNIVREAGDLVIAAFFGAEKDRGRLTLRNENLSLFTERFRKPEITLKITNILNRLREGQLPINPFHWEIEFPEVFSKENPGFDAVVGNPPFAGKNTLINGNRDGYLDWLKTLHEDSHGNADLVAHFFRRAYSLLKKDGCFGLIATNTIGQGDTRSTGLRWICSNSKGTIYSAHKRYRWPGQAAVVVSVVHVIKGDIAGPYDLDGRSVSIITAYLFHAGGHENPYTLEANENQSYQGVIVLGMGFTFDDTDTKGVANPISLMKDLITKDVANQDIIFPYIGGEEINDSPNQSHHRYVINFSDYPLCRRKTETTWKSASTELRAAWLAEGIVPLDYPMPVAADWPDLLQLVENRVKPERTKQKDVGAKNKWWQFIRPRFELARAIEGKEKMIVISRVGNAFAFCFLDCRTIASERLVVFPFESYAAFCILQSRTHEVWSRFNGSSLKDDFMYAPDDCFATFPFPSSYALNATLEQRGKEYYAFRAELMARNNEGLTKTYNRFHNPEENSPEVLRLRELHAAMDRAVLDAYGWSDIPTAYKFILDYEDEDDENIGGRGKKKPWRYRWPDDVRDEILARLLALNATRAEEEKMVGRIALGTKNIENKGKKPRTKNKDESEQASLDIE